MFQISLHNMKFRYRCWINLFIFFGLASQSLSADLGKVIIGSPGEEVTSLTSSNNDLQSDRWYFDVYLQVLNQSSGEFISVDSNVTVSCSLTPAWSGYTNADLNSVTVEPHDTSVVNFTAEPITAQITFTNLLPGRPAEVGCWGQSVLEPIDPGENRTQNASEPQFTKEESMSPPVFFTIYRRASVNICADRIVVPYSDNEKDSAGTFLLEFSDPVETNTSVQVTCNVNPQNESDSDGSMFLKIKYPIEVQEGEKKIEVSYSRANGSKSVFVTCFGQSVYTIGNDTYNGTQFTPETSRGDPVLFVLAEGYVKIYPRVTSLNNDEMKLFLVLDAEVTTEVTFTCRAETALSSEEAVEIARDPYCQSISETIVERPYSNITDNAEQSFTGAAGIRTTTSKSTQDESTQGEVLNGTVVTTGADQETTTQKPLKETVVTTSPQQDQTTGTQSLNGTGVTSTTGPIVTGAKETNTLSKVTSETKSGTSQGVTATDFNTTEANTMTTSEESISTDSTPSDIQTTSIDAISTGAVETTESTTDPNTTERATTLPTETAEPTTDSNTTERATTLPTETTEPTTDSNTTERATTLPTGTTEPTTDSNTTERATTLPTGTTEPTTDSNTTERATTLPSGTTEPTTDSNTTERATTLPTGTTEPTTDRNTTEQGTTLPMSTSTSISANTTGSTVDIDVNGTSDALTTELSHNITTVEVTTESPPTTEPATTESLCFVTRQTRVNESVIVPTLVNGVLVNLTQQVSQVISETVQVNCSDLYPATTPPTTPAPRNITGEWIVREPRVVFEVGKERYKELVVERKSAAARPQEELVVVTCCAPAQTVNPKYRGKSSAALLVTSLTPNVTVNWTAATLPENENTESPIKNPAYVNLAPCPCDQTKGQCDSNCCCDEDCSAAAKSTFLCVSGVEGGLAAPLPGYSCTSPSVIREDWFVLLCVHKENSAFLGYFYPDVLGIRSEVDFRSKAQTSRPLYTYRETEERSQFATGRGYRSGSSIKTGQVAKQVEDNIIPNKNFVLGLPQKSLTGDCVRTSPVQYLVDMETECTQTVMEDLCSLSSPLNALIYAQSTSIENPPCPKAPVIISEGGTKKITTVKTHYLCSTDVPQYLRSTTTLDDLFTPTGKSLFTNDIDTENCDFDPTTKGYVCVTGSNASEALEQPARCTWDDGFTPPPAPVYNSTTRTCHNAMLNLHYNFTWKGNEILLLNATYVLGDLPLDVDRVDTYSFDYIQRSEVSADSGVSEAGTTTEANVAATTAGAPIAATTAPVVSTASPEATDAMDALNSNVSLTVTQTPAVLSQKFKVVFSHEYNAANTSSNDTRRTGRYQRSGKIGYEYDLPLVSGIPVLKDTNLAYVDTGARLSLWSPAPGGLCAGSSQRVTNFGEDAISSCVLRLGLSELHLGCDTLRKQILHHQDSLMTASLVSRNGDPELGNLRQWVGVLRQNISATIPIVEELPMTTEAMTTTEDANSTAAMTSDLPYDVTTANMTDNVTDSGPVIDIETIGRCPNIASGIHLDVLYAVAGAVNSQPVYEIVGAKISYTLSTWSLDCSGANGAACLGNQSQVADDNGGDEAVQSFPLTSSINFHLVPSTEETPKTRFQERISQPFPYCQSDACWEEIFYPFTSSFQGDPRLYVRAVSLTSLIFLIGYLFVTRL